MRQRFLIVCEGEKTEYAYFKAFQVPGLVMKVIPVGKDPLTLLQKAENEAGKAEYDQVWCVFDRDEFPPEQIEQVRSEAKANGYKVAISNQCFELWYLLHFVYLSTPITRQDYIQKLEKHLKIPYAKNDPDMYEKLRDYQDDAIKHAKRLIEQYSPWNPITSDPSTNVYELVEQLRKHSKN